MKKNIVVLLIAFVLSIFQTAFFLEIFGPTLNPNIILAFCFALYIGWSARVGIFGAFVGGLFLDLVTLGPIGLSSLVFCCAVYLGSILQKRVLRGLQFQVIVLILFFILHKILTGTDITNFGSDHILSLFLSLFSFVGFYWLISSFRSRFSKTSLYV
ncbi:hypothetical protein OAL67_00330 [bacterium]|nr:hypothetical protein [bacterium]